MQWWYDLRRRYPALRKGTSLLKQVPRFARRWLGFDGAPPVLANSFPKSGTHLLVQILEALPEVTNYDSFIASRPPVRFHLRSQRTLHRRIGWITPGELVSAHLHHDRVLLPALRGKRCVMYFIYRDPRDVVCSEAHYLTSMNRWHRLHGHFAHRLQNTEERIMTAIVGIEDGSPGYPDVAARFRAYEGWLSEDDVLPIRFEDLVSEARERTVRGIVRHFLDGAGEGGRDLDRVVRAALANIDPQRSRTFRSGRSGGWRERFTGEHRRAFKRVAGDLLVRLGYEDDERW